MSASHLRPEEIDLVIEGAAEPGETLRAEEHLATCPACRKVREERAAFLEAAFSLPDLEVPPDLAEKIAARAFPARHRPASLLAALAGALSLVAFGGLAYVLANGDSLAGFFLGAGKVSWGLAREFSLAFLKGIKLAALFLTLLGRYAADLIEGAGRLKGLIPVEAYAVCFVAALALAVAAAFGLRRFLAQGERP